MSVVFQTRIVVRLRELGIEDSQTSAASRKRGSFYQLFGALGDVDLDRLYGSQCWFRIAAQDGLPSAVVLPRTPFRGGGARRVITCLKSL